MDLTCRLCKKVHRIKFDHDDMEAWKDGAFIQDALPYLTAGERELLKTATCDDCWAAMFPDEDEDDEPAVIE